MIFSDWTLGRILLVRTLYIWLLFLSIFSAQAAENKIGEIVLPDCSSIKSTDLAEAVRNCFDANGYQLNKIYQYSLSNKSSEIFGTVRFFIQLTPDATVESIRLESEDIKLDEFLKVLEYYVKKMQFPKQLAGKKFVYPVNFYKH